MKTSLLSSLKLTTRPKKIETDPLLKRRERLLAKLDVQKDMAQALLNGERYVAYKEKWQVDPDTKTRTLVHQSIKVKPWFYKRANLYFLEIRYGNKALVLHSEKQAIEVGTLDNLLPTIETVIQAVISGELDTVLAAIKPVNKPSTSQAQDKTKQETKVQDKKEETKTVSPTPAVKKPSK